MFTKENAFREGFSPYLRQNLRQRRMANVILWKKRLGVVWGSLWVCCKRPLLALYRQNSAFGERTCLSVRSRFHDFVLPISVSKTLRLVALVTHSLFVFVLGGCDQTRPMLSQYPEWKTQVKPHVQHATLRFEPGSALLSSDQKTKIELLFSQALPSLPLYAEVFVGPVSLLSEERVYQKATLSQDRVDVQTDQVRYQRTQGIMDFLQALGVPRERLRVHVGSSQATQHTLNAVLVLLGQYEVRPPACPGWEDFTGFEASMDGSRTLGCVTERNLARMIAQPQDLIQGQRLSLSPAVAQNPAVEAFFSKSPVTLPKEGIEGQ